MGAGVAKRSLIFRIGAGAIKGALALVLFLFVLLVILRVMAVVRENGAEPPPSTVRFQMPTAAVAAGLSGLADGPPIMLIHGTAAWSGFWRQVADHLARRGRHVIATDVLRGVGHIPHIEDPKAFMAALDGALAVTEKGER